jgi:hypothetical protein
MEMPGGGSIGELRSRISRNPITVLVPEVTGWGFWAAPFSPDRFGSLDVTSSLSKRPPSVRCGLWFELNVILRED